MDNKTFQHRAKLITLSALITIPLMAIGAIGAMEMDKDIRENAAKQEQAEANKVMDKLYGTHDPEQIFAREVANTLPEDVD